MRTAKCDSCEACEATRVVEMTQIGTVGRGLGGVAVGWVVWPWPLVQPYRVAAGRSACREIWSQARCNPSPSPSGQPGNGNVCDHPGPQ